MSACLTTCQYAVAQVTAITRRSDQAPSFHLSMEQLKDSVMATARSEVVDAIGNARRQLVAAELEGEGSMKPYNAGVSFPSHGFWPWTEVFEDPVI